MYGLIEGEPISSGSFPVTGFIGYETVFVTMVEDQEVQMRLVSFAIEGLVTDIYLSAAPELFDEARRDFDMIIASFRVY